MADLNGGQRAARIDGLPAPPDASLYGGGGAAVRLAIIGCGNPARSDDGAGVAVIHRLRRNPLPPDVQLIDAGTSGMEVMFHVRGVARVVLVDACRSGSEAGAIFRLPGREVMTPGQQGYSQHGLRWDHALYAGGRMFGDGFADHTEVILIEAQALGFGLELSAPVQNAVEQVATLLRALVQSLVQAPLQAPAAAHV